MADGGYLELELDELRIEEVEQYVVGALAINHRELEFLVMQALLDTSLCGLIAHSVVFVGRSLHIVQSRFFRPIEAGDEHLCQADIFRPCDSVLLILPKLFDTKVRTHTCYARIAQNPLELGSRIFGEAAET